MDKRESQSEESGNGQTVNKIQSQESLGNSQNHPGLPSGKRGTSSDVTPPDHVSPIKSQSGPDESLASKKVQDNHLVSISATIYEQLLRQ